ncbi:MAG: S-methyl-5'-thioinosine phosphorylase [Coprothermobacterota bacterium]|nr:S-methyl-5'-thioinosine phosphorylase [Coprothermobacterota bacterium]
MTMKNHPAGGCKLPAGGCIAFIGGTGFYAAPFLDDPQEILVETRYGPVRLLKGHKFDREIYFLSRHGAGHSVPPHLVNYRANIAALKTLQVQAIFAATAVGSLAEEMAPGHLVILDQFLDFTKARIGTFFQGEGFPVVHTDMSDPYCSFLRRELAGSADRLGFAFHSSGCYVCTEGPRFESAGEIRMYGTLGGQVVGMTGVPEVVLAREAGICYAGVSLVTNYAAGISPHPLSHEEVVEMMKKNGEHFLTLLMAALQTLPPQWDCSCEKRPEANLITTMPSSEAKG